MKWKYPTICQNEAWRDKGLGLSGQREEGVAVGRGSDRRREGLAEEASWREMLGTSLQAVWKCAL